MVSPPLCALEDGTSVFHFFFGPTRDDGFSLLVNSGAAAFLRFPQHVCKQHFRSFVALLFYLNLHRKQTNTKYL